MRGTVVQVPYPTRSDAESAMPPVKKDEGKEAEVATTSNLEEEKAKEKARKACPVASICYRNLKFLTRPYICGTGTHIVVYLKTRPVANTLPSCTLYAGAIRYHFSSCPSDKHSRAVDRIRTTSFFGML